uniref:NADH dehydrogenase subunit 2 n=1 Tax=Tigrigobius multifasciatus TaxID=203335 RepID=UPI0028FCA449|nr:NADH dehydrogenase subunit 2 [Tigrigobius multifasciatus]WNH38004.1 NADH dehydrogenase subunit 2 [Tigrigobius multifasciatus]
MSPYTMSLLLLSLGLGTTLTFISSHWLMAWMGLEISTLSILPLMAKPHHPRAVEATTKYFLTQATAAATLLFAAISNAWFTGQWNIYAESHPVVLIILVFSLALKMGLAPMHTWLPEVMQGLTLTTGLILSTWQKLAPFAIMVQLPVETHPMLLLMGVTSTLVGGWGGLNQTQLRKILAYSSIAHLGWVAIVVQLSPSLAAFALATYIVMTTTLFLVLNSASTTTITSMAASWMKSPLASALMPLVLLSLSGLPPLTGFTPKWLIVKQVINVGPVLLISIAVMSSLLSLFFYLRLSYYLALTVSPNTALSLSTWRLPHPKLPAPAPVAAALSILLLPLTPGVLTLFSC